MGTDTVTFVPGCAFRTVPARANGHPAVAISMADPHVDVYGQTVVAAVFFFADRNP